MLDRTEGYSRLFPLIGLSFTKLAALSRVHCKNIFGQWVARSAKLSIPLVELICDSTEYSTDPALQLAAFAIS